MSDCKKWLYVERKRLKFGTRMVLVELTRGIIDIVAFHVILGHSVHFSPFSENTIFKTPLYLQL